MNDIYKKVGDDLLIQKDIIKAIYRAYWLFIKTKIQEISFEENLTEEQFNDIITSFNLPKLGKLSVTYDKYQKIQRKNKHIKYEAKHKKDKTDV